MKKKYIAMMAISLLLSIALGGCTQKKPEYPDNAPIFNSDGAIWYDSEVAEYELYVDEADRYGSEVLAVTDDFLYLYERGQSFIGTSWSDSEVVYSDWIYKLTYDGEIAASLDISELSQTIGDVSSHIQKVFYWNNQMYAISQSIDYGNNYEACTSIVPVNIDNGVIGEAFYDDSWSGYFDDEGVSVDCIYTYGEKLIMVFYDYENIVSVAYMNPDFTLVPIDIKTELATSNVCSYYSSFLLDDSTLILRTQDFYGDVFISVNLSDFSTNVVSDVEGSTSDSNISFNDCNVDRYLMSFLHLVYSDDDTFVYWGEVLKSQYERQLMCVKLTRSDNDLREGKGILTACCLGDTRLTPEQARAIYEFNNTSDSYYILLDDTFEASYFYDNSLSYTNGEEYIEYHDNLIKGEYELSNALAIALMNGQGPDTIFNGYEYTTLNNDDCLINMSPFINAQDGVDPELYFNGVFSMPGNDGVIYQIPTSISLTGLIIKDNPVDGPELEFDEYIRVVDEINNGYDPLNSEGRQSLFYRLLSYSGISIVQDGRADINDEEFRMLVDYCKDLLEAPEEYMPGYQYPYYRVNNIEMFYMSSPLSLMNTSRNLNHDVDSVLYGFPGTRGPVIGVDGTVAITANCSSFNGAFQFIQTLLSTQVQKHISIYSVPLNKEAFDLYCDELINQSEEYMEYYENSYLSWEVEYNNYNTFCLTQADVDIYRESLENASFITPIDPQIKIIIWEEIQMYYAGDRSFEETVSVMENRIQTVLDERG